MDVIYLPYNFDLEFKARTVYSIWALASSCNQINEVGVAGKVKEAVLERKSKAILESEEDTKSRVLVLT